MASHPQGAAKHPCLVPAPCQCLWCVMRDVAWRPRVLVVWQTGPGKTQGMICVLDHVFSGQLSLGR